MRTVYCRAVFTRSSLGPHPLPVNGLVFASRVRAVGAGIANTSIGQTTATTSTTLTRIRQRGGTWPCIHSARLDSRSTRRGTDSPGQTPLRTRLFCFFPGSLCGLDFTAGCQGVLTMKGFPCFGPQPGAAPPDSPERCPDTTRARSSKQSVPMPHPLNCRISDIIWSAIEVEAAKQGPRGRADGRCKHIRGGPWWVALCRPDAGVRPANTTPR